MLRAIKIRLYPNKGQELKLNKVFVSEYWMPEDFKCVWQKQITNSMHPTKTKKAIEKLFTL